MPDAQTEQHAMLGDAIDTLTSQIQRLPASTPEETVEYACSQLALIQPISSAGMFHHEQSTSSLQWIYQSQPVVPFMDESLTNHYRGLTDMLSGGDALQAADDGSIYFTALPAGQFNGRAIGLGVSSERNLDHNELSRLGSFGFLVSLIAENIRLQQQIVHAEESRSTARLIGFIAHELRTPLTGMRGNIQLALMANRKGQHDRIPTRLESAISSVDDMSGLVQRLLDVSRLERGVFTLSPSEARLTDTISRAVDELQGTAFSDIDVEVSGDAALAMTGDHEALERSIHYLLKNVSAYTEPGSPVTIAVRNEDQYVGFDLSYTGEQFSGNDLAALSEPISIAKPSSDQHDNLSLELAFCRGIIAEHRGWIRLYASDSDQRNQCIEIRLPSHVEA